MKGIKLSKTGWLILSGGVFVVMLAGLGVTRSQQMGEQNRLNEELGLSETRLDKLDVTDLRRQLEDLGIKVEESQGQLEEARERLRQTVVSVDVTDEFFKIAEYSGVTVTSMSTSVIAPNELEGIGLQTIALSAQVEGDFEKIVDFVINLNNGYATGHVKTAQIDIPLLEPVSAEGEETSGEELGGGEEGGGEEGEGEVIPTDEDLPSVGIQMIVYSYEGK
jgi:hypothetical protein